MLAGQEIPRKHGHSISVNANHLFITHFKIIIIIIIIIITPRPLSSFDVPYISTSTRYLINM